jgi:hypothetical protein
MLIRRSASSSSATAHRSCPATPADSLTDLRRLREEGEDRDEEEEGDDAKNSRAVKPPKLLVPTTPLKNRGKMARVKPATAKATTNGGGVKSLHSPRFFFKNVLTGWLKPRKNMR